MRKPEETRTVYKVQAYLTPNDYAALEKYCNQQKEKMSSVVRDFIKYCLER